MRNIVNTIAILLVGFCAMVTTPEANASTLTQANIEKMTRAYFNPVDTFIDKGSLTKLVIRCSTSDRVKYNCKFLITNKYKAKMVLSFSGVIHKGNKSTRINRWLNGVVRLSNTKYIRMTNLSLIDF